MSASIAVLESETDATIPQKLLTAKQAADVLVISPRKLWALTASREIPHVRLGERTVRYKASALADWIDSKTVSVQSRRA